MKLLEKLLVAVVAIVMAGVLGPAQSETAGRTALAPVVQEPSALYTGSGVSMPPSFADGLGYSAGAGNRAVSAGAAATGLVQTAAPGAALISSANRSVSALGPVTFSSVAGNEWLNVLAAGGLAVRTPDRAHGRSHAELPLPASALPGHDGWRVLLCGLVVMAFIARRKTSLAAS